MRIISEIKVANKEFSGDIQGLRAIAVLGVILFHANKEWLPGGFVGVDVFFVISGFLITDIILKKKAVGNFSFPVFYLSRARRIAPAYFVMLAFVTMCSAILFTPKDFSIFWQGAQSAMYFASNQYFLGFGDYFAPKSYELPLLHTWSLAIEMQIYLLLPAFLVILPKKLLWPIVWILMSLLFLFGIGMVDDGNKKAAYFSLLSRAPEFLVGVSLASLVQNNFFKRVAPIKPVQDVLFALGLGMIFYSFVFIDEASNFPGAVVAVPCLGTAFVIAGRGGRGSTVLSSAPMLWIGGLSYSLYLWHWPVFAFARYYNGQYALKGLWLILCLLIILIVSYVSFRLIESPFRRKDFFVHYRLAKSVLIVGIIAPALVAQRVNAKIGEPLPVQYTRYADPSTICHSKIVGNCLRGSSTLVDGELPILVLGDSHAAQLNLFFDRVGKVTGKQYRVISASSCVTIPGFDVERLPDYAKKSCSDSIEFAQKFIPESKEIVVAAMWQYQLQSTDFILALRDFLSASRAAGKKITVLWQIPMLSDDVQRMRRFEALGLRKEVRIHHEWKAANQQIEQILAQYPDVRFLDFSAEDLFSNLPFFKGVLVYGDSDHLNEAGSLYYADRAVKHFNN